MPIQGVVFRTTLGLGLKKIEIVCGIPKNVGDCGGDRRLEPVPDRLLEGHDQLFALQRLT